MPKPKKPSPAPAAETASPKFVYKEAVSLTVDAIAALCRPVMVRSYAPPGSDQPFKIECRRLTAGEKARVDVFEMAVMPASRPAMGKDGKPDLTKPAEFDLSDPTYPVRRQQARREARALACVLGVKMIADLVGPALAANPTAEQLPSIIQIVESTFDESILEDLFTAVMSDAVVPLGEAKRFF